MKKLLLLMASLAIVSVLSAGKVQAREGVVKLSGPDVSCEGVSLWKGRNYSVSGRCEGLVYPYATQRTHYVLWARTDDASEYVRIADVEVGYFDGSVSDNFGSVLLTAESDGLPRRPSDITVADGEISGFSFARDEGGAVRVEPTPTPVPENGQITVQGDATAESGSGVGSVIGRILRSLLVIIAVVVVIVVVTSLVFRRRGSVSG